MKSFAGRTMTMNTHTKIENQPGSRTPPPQNPPIIKRGDVVILRHPKENEQLYIKRVVGLPGEKVKIKRGHLTVNGQTLKESYSEGWMFEEREVELNANEYYVLGDNRLNSIDSRMFGPIKHEHILRKILEPL